MRGLRELCLCLAYQQVNLLHTRSMSTDEKMYVIATPFPANGGGQGVPKIHFRYGAHETELEAKKAFVAAEKLQDLVELHGLDAVWEHVKKRYVLLHVSHVTCRSCKGTGTVSTKRLHRMDDCIDCGCESPDDYMVHRELWADLGLTTGQLCLECLDARMLRVLGRGFSPLKDLQPGLPINHAHITSAHYAIRAFMNENK